MRTKFLVAPLLAFGIFVAFSFTFSEHAYAAGCSWNGSADDTWSNASNWDAGCSGGGGVPGNTDDLTFPASTSNTSMNLDIAGLTLNSLTFGGDLFSLSGNDFSLAAGLSLADTGYLTINNNITLTSDQEFTSVEALHINGNIARTGQLLTLNTSNDIQLHGNLTGTGDLDIQGTGRVILDGTNTFVGNIDITTTLTDVRFSSDSAAGDSSNIISNTNYNPIIIEGDNLTIPNDFNLADTTILYNLGTNNTLTGNITAANDMTIYTQIGDLEITGVLAGNEITAYGQNNLTLSGNADNTVTTFIIQTAYVIANKTSADAFGANLEVGIGAGAADSSRLTINAANQIPTTTAVTIKVDGQLLMNGFDQTFNNLTIQRGELNTGNGDVYVTGDLTLTGSTFDTGTGILDLAGDLITSSISGEYPVIDGAGLNFSGVSQKISTASVTSDYELTISSPITGSSTITLEGGKFLFTGNLEGFSGDIILGDISEAKLVVEGTIGLGDGTGSVTINNASTLVFKNSESEIDTAFLIEGVGEGNGAIVFRDTNTPDLLGTITLTGDSLIGVGSDLDVSLGTIAGPYDLTLLGLGSIPAYFLMEDDSPSYNQTVYLDNSAGLFQADFSQTTVSISPGAWVGGEGIIYDIIGTDILIDPGSRTGVLSVQNNLTLSSDTTLIMELFGENTGEYDQLNISGGLSIDNAELIIDLESNYIPAKGEQFIIIMTNDGNITGEFSGMADGDIVTVNVAGFGEAQFMINYYEQTVVLTSYTEGVVEEEGTEEEISILAETGNSFVLSLIIGVILLVSVTGLNSYKLRTRD